MVLQPAGERKIRKAEALLKPETLDKVQRKAKSPGD